MMNNNLNKFKLKDHKLANFQINSIRFKTIPANFKVSLILISKS